MGLWDKLKGKPSQKKFAAQLQAALIAAGDPRTAQFDPEEFRILFFDGDDEQGVLNLSNLYAEYCALPSSQRPKRISELVRASLSHLKEIPTEFSDASYDIRPRIWTKATFEQISLRALLDGDPKINWPMEPIGDHLLMSLVYDLPESVRSISNEDLETWDVTYWQAREVAMKNLAESEFVYASLGDELFASSTGDSYDATRLVMVDLVRGLDIKGQPVAMVPNRDTLLISGTESEVGLKMMVEFAIQQLQEQPRPLIATPLILTENDEWTDWMPDRNDPNFEQFHKLKLGWLQQEYHEQKELLERLHEEQEIDEFVASFTVAEKEGALHSYCVWTKTVISQLPETDLVMLFDPDSEASSLASWEALQKTVPHLFEPLDCYPLRYRVTGFPTKQHMFEMNAQSL